MQCKIVRLVFLTLCAIKLLLFCAILVVSLQLMLNKANKYTKWIEDKFQTAHATAALSKKQRHAQQTAVQYKKDMQRTFALASIFFLSLASIGALVQVVGAIGAFGYNKCLVVNLFFDVLLLVLFTALSALTAYLWFATSTYPKHEKALLDGFAALFMGTIQLRAAMLNDRHSIVDDMQQLNDDYECCGFYDYLDWFKHNVTIPRATFIFSSTTLVEETVFDVPSYWLSLCVQKTKIEKGSDKLCAAPSACCRVSVRDKNIKLCNAATMSIFEFDVNVRTEQELAAKMDNARLAGKIKPLDSKDIYTEGCIESILRVLSVVLKQIAIVSIVTCVILFISAMAGLYLFCCT